MLEHFFGSKTRVKLLQIFFRAPEQSFYLRELARLARTQLHAIRREVANLEAIGLIAPADGQITLEGKPTSGRSKYYRLEQNCVVYPELRDLLLKVYLLEEKELVDQLRQR